MKRVLVSKQDYSDVIKNYKKLKRKKRNRSCFSCWWSSDNFAIQSKKDKKRKIIFYVKED